MVPRKFIAHRIEQRIPMEVGVELSGASGPGAAGAEVTFTQNVSSRGARVISVRRWRPEDVLKISSLPGSFRATARVAYCDSQREGGFAIGLEFLEPAGTWVIPSAGSGAILNG